MNFEVKMRYMIINLNHFRRCMLSRVRYHLSSKGKKQNSSAIFCVDRSGVLHPEDRNSMTISPKKPYYNKP
ncbi:MAG: hypothetical protein AWU59_1657 [Methanolobus sp. T82-4]|nr:MAG: hypothetical protein AWU59_1657 [Methanolobus sp. T82-4]